MPVTAQEALGYFHAAGYALLDIQSAHALAVERLPMLRAIRSIESWLPRL